jgi:hypothetical protein
MDFMNVSSDGTVVLRIICQRKHDKYRESKFTPCRCFSAALTLRLDGGSQAPHIERDTSRGRDLCVFLRNALHV